MQNYLSPNDERFIGESDSKSTQNAIDEAEKGPVKTVCIPRVCARTGAEEWMNDEGEEFGGCALDIRRMRDADYFKNVIFSDIFTRDGTKLCIACDKVKPDIRN